MNLTENELKIYYTLKLNGPLNRDELVKITGLPRSTVYDNLIKLDIKHLVESIDVKHKYNELNKLKKKTGRPTKYFKLKKVKK